MRGSNVLDEQGAEVMASTLSDAVEKILASCSTDELKQQAAILLKNAIYNSAGFLNTQTLGSLWNSGDKNMITIADNLHIIALTLAGDGEALFAIHCIADPASPSAEQLAAEVCVFAFQTLDKIFQEKFPLAHAALQKPSMIPFRN